MYVCVYVGFIKQNDNRKRNNIIRYTKLFKNGNKKGYKIKLEIKIEQKIL